MQELPSQITEIEGTESIPIVKNLKCNTELPPNFGIVCCSAKEPDKAS